MGHSTLSVGPEHQNPAAHAMHMKLEQGTARVGVVGLGYVGLPLAMACTEAGYVTTGFDIDRNKVESLAAGRSYIDAVRPDRLLEGIALGRFSASTDMADLATCDVIAICVPTPLSRDREPDLGYIKVTAREIARHLRSGQLVILESTTYPGTTEEVLVPILESAGLTSGKDVFVGFSPEREDPGNYDYPMANIPKVVSGHGEIASALVDAFYLRVACRTVMVSSPGTAEAVKITENVFRAVNVALVNELKVIYDAMGIDIWEVIDAAATKPFGFMPFYPGPGIGGHCIPIDPFYLAWRAREFGIASRFIELAGEINLAMPKHILSRLDDALDCHVGKTIRQSRVLLLGIAYKRNVSDVRESPSLVLLERLLSGGCTADYHDPHVPEIPLTREYADLAGIVSVGLDDVSSYDAVLIATDHDVVDYVAIARHAAIVVDCRNALHRRGLFHERLVKA